MRRILPAGRRRVDRVRRGCRRARGPHSAATLRRRATRQAMIANANASCGRAPPRGPARVGKRAGRRTLGGPRQELSTLAPLGAITYQPAPNDFTPSPVGVAAVLVAREEVQRVAVVGDLLGAVRARDRAEVGRHGGPLRPALLCVGGHRRPDLRARRRCSPTQRRGRRRTCTPSGASARPRAIVPYFELAGDDDHGCRRRLGAVLVAVAAVVVAEERGSPPRGGAARRSRPSSTRSWSCRCSRSRPAASARRRRRPMSTGSSP